MTKFNNDGKFVPNTPKTYEVRYNETPSFEEFMKTYKADENVTNSYKDEVEYVNVWASKGSGPCNRSDCSCSPEELRRQARELNEKANERTPFASFTVEIVNSSGTGWGSKGRCHVDLDSKSAARTFISRVQNGWVSHDGCWSSSGSGWITSGKRGKIARAVERRLDGSSSGNVWDSEVKES